jgi:DNA-binding transcriptional ArsR family regulator
MDYKTIRHHLGVLERNGAVSVMNRESYGAMYFISSRLEDCYMDFNDIWEQIGGGDP